MPRYVAFLRGINLGKRRPPMSRLKELFEELGFADFKTFVTSGNVIFSTKAAAGHTLEAKIAQHLEKSLGYNVDTFIRTVEEVVPIGTARIFPEDGREGTTIHVSFLQEKLPADIAKKLAAIRTPHDELHVTNREFYWLCRIKSNESKIWISSEMKALKLPTSTMRNLTSIRKLIAQHAK